MDIEPAVAALLILRCRQSAMPELYRRSVLAAHPIEAILSLPQLAAEWPELFRLISDPVSIERARDDLARWSKADITWTVIGDENYPRPLLSIYDPPPILFLRGVLKSEFFGFAIVGSRRADDGAFATARSVAREMVRRGAVIVSGLALGVDAAAHRGSLEGDAEFPTIAVLGTGIEKIYPAANRDLAHDIVRHSGALISQFEPESPVFPSNFIARNRVIAGLAQGTFVVQAAKNSGSLATARFALEEGRDVFVAPGNFDDKRYEGSNRLLRDGAMLVTTCTDIIDFYPGIAAVEIAENALNNENLSPLAQQILNILRVGEPQSIEELKTAITLQSAELESELLQLEIAQLIDRLPGNRVRAVHT